MLLLVHILIALFSLGLATYVYFRPAKSMLNVSYISVALTLISGIALVVLNSLSLAHACGAGIVYTSFTFYLISIGKRRLQVEATS